MVRIGTTQPRNRSIDWRLPPEEAAARVGPILTELEALIDQAGNAGCDVVALPEDTLGTLHWECAHPDSRAEVLRNAVPLMLERLGAAAARHRMYLVCCNDAADAEGALRNTAFFLGRDGQEIGRYHKVNLPIHESERVRGDGFPVFETPDLGGVGLLICYDMVFPEAARCLTLGGADVIFHLTLGGAAIGDGDVSRCAFRTRAVENFVYLVVAQRGHGSMVIAPTGEVMVEAEGQDTVAIAEIDPFGGRAGGDAMNHQRDMRARLFRERHPAAFDILTDPHPPVLTKVPETVTAAEAARVSAGVLTVGAQRFEAADALLREGKTSEAAQAFQGLQKEYPHSWIDRVARERLAKLGLR